MSSTFSLINKTRGNLLIGRLPLRAIKEKVLGSDYELSLAFVSEKESHKLNLKLRGKDKPTNILSFPLTKTSGEILISPGIAKKEASKFGRTFSNYLAFLFIHGLIHLKGFDHGSKMEHEEEKIRKQFGI